jgi:S-adenosyl-L-methionine hydrolase (adenosine-forming)
MPIVTLTTDLGTKDAYVPMIKGSLLSFNQNLNLVDLSHDIPAFDVFKGAEILKQAYPYFPENSLHLLAINPYDIETYPLIMIKYQGHYFVGADNGMLSFIAGEKADWAIALIPQEVDVKWKLFPFVPFFLHAVECWQSGNFSKAGEVMGSIVQKKPFESYVSLNNLIGYVTHIDHFGNAITNITKEDFEKAKPQNGFSIEFRTYRTDYLNEHYEEVPPGEQAVLFNSSGFLEIAINSGDAGKLMGLKRNDKVVIRFENAE